MIQKKASVEAAFDHISKIRPLSHLTSYSSLTLSSVTVLRPTGLATTRGSSFTPIIVALPPPWMASLTA